MVKLSYCIFRLLHDFTSSSMSGDGGSKSKEGCTSKSKSKVEYVRQTISPYDLASGDNPWKLTSLKSQPLSKGKLCEWSANLLDGSSSKGLKMEQFFCSKTWSVWLSRLVYE